MSDKLTVIRNEIQSIRPEFISVNTGDLKFEKEIEFAIQILSKNDYLARANPASIRNAVKNCALTDLTLNPTMKMAYLIPRVEKVNGVKELQCQLEPSYMGLCKILTDTGSVKGISATIVYEKEVGSLKIQQGIAGHASHDPHIGFDKPGKPIACYSKAILPDGTQHVELLRPWEWEDIMKRSESVKSYNAKKAKGEYAAIPTWISDLEEMIRKTCIKKHYKYLPKTKRAEQVAAAIALDDDVNGIDFDKQNQQAQQEAAKEKAETLNLDLLDPSNEEHQKTFEAFIALFSDPILPETLNDGAINVKQQAESFQKSFDAGTLNKDMANNWLKYIKAEIKKLKSQPKEGEQKDEEIS